MSSLSFPVPQFLKCWRGMTSSWFQNHWLTMTLTLTSFNIAIYYNVCRNQLKLDRSVKYDVWLVLSSRHIQISECKLQGSLGRRTCSQRRQLPAGKTDLQAVRILSFLSLFHYLVWPVQDSAGLDSALLTLSIIGPFFRDKRPATVALASVYPVSRVSGAQFLIINFDCKKGYSSSLILSA